MRICDGSSAVCSSDLRTVISSPTPIDVIGGGDLEKLGGRMQLRDALTQLVPSFQSTTVGSSSFNSLTRPAGLRGLSGVHVLVLVHSSEEHTSELQSLMRISYAVFCSQKKHKKQQK